MVHFVLFDPENHLEARLACGRHSGGHAHALAEEVIIQLSQPACEPIAFAAKQVDYLRFAPGFLFHCHELANQGREIQSFQRGEFLTMDALRHGRRRGNVNEHLRDRSRFRRGSIAVLRFRKLLGDDYSILADSAKTVGEFFGSVVVHSFSFQEVFRSCKLF
jgi:hypothetical protein